VGVGAWSEKNIKYIFSCPTPLHAPTTLKLPLACGFHYVLSFGTRKLREAVNSLLLIGLSFGGHLILERSVTKVLEKSQKTKVTLPIFTVASFSLK